MNIRNFSESDKAMPAGVCHLTLTYGFQVSQPKTLMVGVCGFRLTVFYELRVKIYLLVVDKVSFSYIWKCLFSVSAKGGLCIDQF